MSRTILITQLIFVFKTRFSLIFDGILFLKMKYKLTVQSPWNNLSATWDGPLQAAGTNNEARQALSTALEKTIEGPDLPHTRQPPSIGPANCPQRKASRIIDSARSSCENSIRITSWSSVRLRLEMLTSMSQCQDVSMIAWLSSWFARSATEELVSTAPHSAKPTATRDATMCRARTAAINDTSTQFLFFPEGIL